MVTLPRRAPNGKTKVPDEEVAAATGNGVMSGIFNEQYEVYFEWYIAFLKGQLKGIPETLTPALQGRGGPPDNNGTPAPNEADLFNCLKCIANEVSKEKNLALAQVHETLCKELLQNKEGSNQNTYDMNAAQFIFIAFGLLTMLYEPDLNPESETFKISYVENGWTPSAWTTKKIDIKYDNTSKPMPGLLRRFAVEDGAIPRSQIVANQDHSASNRFKDSTSIVSANVNFYTLLKLARIEIIWTGSACQHLELDVRNKKLMLFCYPSFCALMCAGQLKPNTSGSDIKPPLTQQFFKDYFKMNTNGFGTAGFGDTARTQLNETPGKFYQEIIESYRVIFGQDKLSWELFGPAAAGRFHKGIIEFHRMIFGQDKHSWELCGPTASGKPHDPLLRDLCNKSWSEQGVYRDIKAGPAKLVYPASDFVYFADRLLTLQEFVLMERPNDWKTLWYDRRDIGRFWALWAVVWFGGITIVLSIIQIGLGIPQVVLSAVK